VKGNHRAHRSWREPRRIVAQLFSEALSRVDRHDRRAVGRDVRVRWERTPGWPWGGRPPFWWNDTLAPETLLYAGVLALLAAVLVGVIPGLKATGPQMQTRLKHAGAGSSALKFGGVWTAVIVGQVALTVFFLLSVVSIGSNVCRSIWPYRRQVSPGAMPLGPARAG
jgi:hypothetical protein